MAPRPHAKASPAPRRTVASWNTRYLLAYAVGRGLSRQALEARFGLDAAAVDDVDGRVPFATHARMWQELPSLTGDDDMPLHVVEHSMHLEPPLTALLFLSADNLGLGLARLTRYQRVTLDVSDEPAGELSHDCEGVHLVFHHHKSAVAAPTGAVVDALLAILLMARLATRQPIAPRSLRLRHPRPARPSLYEDAFGCPIDFAAPLDRMTLDPAVLDLPHPDASRTLSVISERYAEGTLAALPTGGTLLSDVRRAVRARLVDGDIELSTLARSVGMAARTLQRRLADEQTSLRQLVDDERRQLALALVADLRVSLVDVAFRLGFSDQAAFSRAFSRWTGRSPGAHRRALSRPAGAPGT